MHNIVAVNGITRRNSSLVSGTKSPLSMFPKYPSYPHIQPILVTNGLQFLTATWLQEVTQQIPMLPPQGDNYVPHSIQQSSFL